jgi:hypothetical protein
MSKYARPRAGLRYGQPFLLSSLTNSCTSGGSRESYKGKADSAQSLKLVNGDHLRWPLVKTAKRLTVVSKGTFLSRSLNTSDLGKDLGGHHVACPLAPGSGAVVSSAPAAINERLPELSTPRTPFVRTNAQTEVQWGEVSSGTNNIMQVYYDNTDPAPGQGLGHQLWDL